MAKSAINVRYISEQVTGSEFKIRSKTKNKTVIKHFALMESKMNEMCEELKTELKQENSKLIR